MHADESLENDASFFWRVWHIQQSKIGDTYRKKYIEKYLSEESSRIFIGASLGIVPSLLIISAITFPFPVLLILTAASAVGAIYTVSKVAEHGYGFFKARAEFSTPATKDALTI